MGVVDLLRLENVLAYRKESLTKAINICVCVCVCVCVAVVEKELAEKIKKYGLNIFKIHQVPCMHTHDNCLCRKECFFTPDDSSIYCTHR